MLISVEGLDGAGGTTLVRWLDSELDNTRTTAEPSELWTGKQVRRCLQDESIDPLTDFYFFMGDRIHHVETTVKPAAENGKTVISDRYADSTRAYQPVALAKSDHFETQTQAKAFINQSMHPWNHTPDLTLYLDISVDTAIERSAGDEKFEKREFLAEVRENYEKIAEHPRVVTIDGEQSINGVREDAMEAIDRKI